MAESVKAYWDERARDSGDSRQATTNDVYLRELEIKTLIEALKELPLPASARILDLGCGDGYSTVKVAEQFPGAAFLGIDYSENMVEMAKRRASSNAKVESRIDFKVGDATQLLSVCEAESFDAIMTDRCLINLQTSEVQYAALGQIAECLVGGGHYIAIENFLGGQRNLNENRVAMGLPEIAIRWHNVFFDEDDFCREATKHFDTVEFRNFASSYYYATRIIYSAMCKLRGEDPRYDDDIYKIAVDLPWAGDYSPIKMALMRRLAL